MNLLGYIKSYLSWRGLKYIIKCLLLSHLPLIVLIYLQWQLKASPGPVPGKGRGQWNKVKPLRPLIVKQLWRQENCAHKSQLTEFISTTNLINWWKNSRKEGYYTNEDGKNELLFSSQQRKAKNFRKHCCNVTFLLIQQQLANNIIDFLKRSHQQTIIEIQGEHQLAILDPDKRIQTIQYENVGLQVEIWIARQTVMDLIKNRDVLQIGKYDNILCVF